MNIDGNEPNLFDVNQFTSAPDRYQMNVTGPDPSWATPDKSNTNVPPSSVPPAKPLAPQKRPVPPPIQRPSLQEIADEVRDSDLEVVAAPSHPRQSSWAKEEDAEPRPLEMPTQMSSAGQRSKTIPFATEAFQAGVHKKADESFYGVGGITK